MLAAKPIPGQMVPEKVARGDGILKAGILEAKRTPVVEEIRAQNSITALQTDLLDQVSRCLETSPNDGISSPTELSATLTALVPKLREAFGDGFDER